MREELVLYEEQEELVKKVSSEWRNKHRFPLLQSSTGSGKTAMATKIIQRSLRNGVKCAFVVPRKTLFQQTSETFKKYGIHHSHIASGKSYNPFADVYLCMADTLAGRIEAGKVPDHIGLIEIDETRFGDSSIDTIVNHYKKYSWVDQNGKKRRTYGLGLDATPWKMNGQGLGVWYDVMIQGKSIRELIDMGRLSDYNYYYGRPEALNGGKVKFKNGKEEAEYMEAQGVIIGDCVTDYEKRCLGKMHLVRCTSIKHSQTTAAAFQEKGYNFVHVDGKTKNLEQILRAYARREIHGITFADLLNFGFDLSQATGMDVTIESGSDLKPSQSLSGQLQWWGRLIRWKPFNAIINDHVNNYLTHGLPCSDREWTLDSLASRPTGEKAPPTKQCPQCMCVHPPAPRCPDCKLIYEVREVDISQVAGELHEMDKEEFKRRNSFDNSTTLDDLLPPLDDEQSLDYLIKYANKMGYREPIAWAANELQKRIMEKQKKYV